MMEMAANICMEPFQNGWARHFTTTTSFIYQNSCCSACRPITYCTIMIYIMLNIIGLFFIHHFYLSNSHTHREYIGGDSKLSLNKILNFKIKVNKL